MKMRGYWRGGVRVLTPTAADGASIRVIAWPAKKGTRRRWPVMMVPGFASNARFFDLNERYSLARHAHDQGFQVYLVDIRGTRHTAVGAHQGWDFDAYHLHDMPAAIDTCLADAGTEALHVVGHSMGGMLLLAQAVEAKYRFASLCTIGTGMIRHLSWGSIERGIVHLSAKAYNALSRRHLPVERFLRLTRPLAGPVGKRLMDGIIFNGGNMHPEVVEGLAAEVVGNISVRLVRQFMAHANGEAHIGSLDYENHLRKVRVPTTLLAGSADQVFPIYSTRRLLSEVRSPLLSYRELGRTHGDSADYGHVDLLFGRNAPDEVYPVVTESLLRADARTPSL